MMKPCETIFKQYFINMDQMTWYNVLIVSNRELSWLQPLALQRLSGFNFTTSWPPRNSLFISEDMKRTKLVLVLDFTAQNIAHKNNLSLWSRKKGCRSLSLSCFHIFLYLSFPGILGPLMEYTVKKQCGSTFRYLTCCPSVFRETPRFLCKINWLQ